MVKRFCSILATIIIGLNSAEASQAPVAATSTLENEIAAAERLISSGAYTQARQMVENLLAASPDDVRLRLLAGRLYRKLGRWSLSVLEYENALRLDSSKLEPYLALSEMYLENLNAERALLMAREAVAIDPGLKQGRILLVEALIANYNSHEAKEEFEKMKISYPSDPDVLYLAFQLYRDNGDLKMARESLETALRLKPDQISWLFDLCEICQSTGEYGEARSAMVTYLKVEPDSVRANIKLAEVLEYGLRDLHGARAAYKKALELDPENLTAAGGIERLVQKNNDVAAAIRTIVRSLFAKLWSIITGGSQSSG
ncbi:MAG: tetratricopeptide repeat protein [Cyanobacteria bacterium]|nr:tetratricopeptide repeat protein [Cyanobacteriota bacterium]